MNRSFTEGVCKPQPVTNLGIWEICIPTIGIPINAVAIFVIMSLKEYKKSISHWYVLQLAWADILFLALLPLMAHQHFTGLWNFSEASCKLFQGVFMMTYHAGILFLTVMSFDRYIAIVHPVNVFWRKFRTRKTSFIVTGIVWTVALLLSIPFIVWSQSKCSCVIDQVEAEEEREFYDNDYYENFISSSEDGSSYGPVEELDESHYISSGYSTTSVKDIHTREDVCFQPAWPSLRIWLILNFLFIFFLPIVIMVVCYGLILKRILQPSTSSFGRSGSCSSSTDGKSQKRNGKTESKHRLGSTSSQQSRRVKQQRKITYIVVILVVAFLLCWSPFQFVQLTKINGLKLPKLFCHQLIDVATILAYANSMINPILYTVLGSKFYRRLSSAITCFGTRQRGSSFSRSSMKSNNRATSLKARTVYTTAQHKSVTNAEMSITNFQHSECASNNRNHSEYEEKSQVETNPQQTQPPPPPPASLPKYDQCTEKEKETVEKEESRLL